MIRYENECVDCGLPCIGNSCIYRSAARYRCDDCGEEVGCDMFGQPELYEVDGGMVCWDCKCQAEYERELMELEECA